MTYADFFYEIKGRFMEADRKDVKERFAGEHLAFQFNIEDEESGGIFYVEVKDGDLLVEPYEYYDRDAMFTCAPDVLLGIANGELDPVAAYTEEKLKVEGNLEKALRLKEIVETRKAAAQSANKGVSKKTGKGTGKKTNAGKKTNTGKQEKR